MSVLVAFEHFIWDVLHLECSMINVVYFFTKFSDVSQSILWVLADNVATEGVFVGWYGPNMKIMNQYFSIDNWFDFIYKETKKDWSVRVDGTNIVSRELSKSADLE